MEFLGIGPLELLLIVVLTLIVFSPKDIAGGGKAVGRWLNRLYRSDTYRSMKQVSQELQDLPNRLAQEAHLDELKDLEKEVKAAGDSLRLEVPSAPPIPPVEIQNKDSEDSTKPDANPEPSPPEPADKA